MNTFQKIVVSRVTVVTLLIAAAYWLMVAFIPFGILRETLDAILVPLSILVLIIYLPITSQELLKNRLDKSGRLLMGIVLSWTSMTLLRPLGIWARVSGKLGVVSQSPFYGFIIWMMIWAAILHITAPGADAGEVPRWNWPIFVALVAGGIIAGIVIGVQLGYWLSQPY